MEEKWYNQIDWGPFMWFGCFVILIIIAVFVRSSGENKIVGDLLLIAAGSVGPRIRSTPKK